MLFNFYVQLVPFWRSQKRKRVSNRSGFANLDALIYGNRCLGLYCFQQPIEVLHSINLDRYCYEILKMVERTHWFMLSLMGTQFNISNSFCDIWANLSRLRQSRIHFFEVVWNLYFNFLLGSGYHAEHAESKYGWINALLKSSLRPDVEKMFFQTKS